MFEGTLQKHKQSFFLSFIWLLYYVYYLSTTSRSATLFGLMCFSLYIMQYFSTPFPLISFLSFLLLSFQRGQMFKTWINKENFTFEPCVFIMYLFSHQAHPRSVCTSFLFNQPWMSCTSCQNTLAVQRAWQMMTGAVARRMSDRALEVSGQGTLSEHCMCFPV